MKQESPIKKIEKKNYWLSTSSQSYKLVPIFFKRKKGQAKRILEG